MIISASRRTDIPAFYSEWLINRIRAGFCLTQNPMNPAQIRRVSLAPRDVDGIVLWTKNAAPLLPSLGVLEPFPRYFQYTVTPYSQDIERGLPSKRDTVIPAFLELSSRIGAERVVWRYDPILFTQKYDFAYHIRAFSRLCELLSGSTKKCVVSFVIAYKSIAKSLRDSGIIAPGLPEKLRLLEAFIGIAAERGIELCACCESPEVYALGVKPIACVDAGLLGISDAAKDKNQRSGCNCAASVDIGAYNSCLNGCVYCYANHGTAKVRGNAARHSADDELLI